MLELQQPEFGVNFSELSFFIKPEMKLVPSIDLAGGGGGFELFEFELTE